MEHERGKKMQTRPLGESGIEASVIAFGAWAIGGWMWGGTDEKEAVAAVHAALDCGMTFIDTAPMYGMGRSEEIIGKALKGGYRQKAVLATKCTLVWDGSGEDGEYFFPADDQGRVPDDTPNPKYKVYRNNKPRLVRKGVEESLRRLQTDVIDLLQTHWQDSTTPIAETMEELVKLKKEGKIRAIGVCNATPEQLEEYRQAGPLDSDQEKYNMLDRGMEKTNLPYCKDNKLAFLAYSPLAQGLLTGAIGPDRVFKPGDLRATNPRYSQENRAKVGVFLTAVQPIADDYKASLGQLVAAWTVSQPGCSHALLGARNARQVEENAKAGELRLEAGAVEAITKAVDAMLRDVV